MPGKTCKVVRLGRLPAIALLIGSGCSTATLPWSGAEEIRSVLSAQQAAWNDGEIEVFMEPYWQSADLSFSSGGRVTRGWDETLAGYRKRYPTRDAMGHLTFGELEITRLAADAALVLGRWQLERDEPVGGTFTLVLRKNRGRWVIVHDHTSREGP